MKRFLLLFSIVLTTQFSFGQLANKAFMPVESNKQNSSLYGELDFTGFFKNNEYFTRINPGQTFLGWHVFPKAHFKASDQVKLTGGFLFQNTFGIDSIQVKPTFTLTTNIKKWTIAFGSIDNTLKHQLIEPLMDYESYFYDRIEEGFEVEYKDSTKTLDLWIDWEKAITRNSENQESFFVGLKANKRLIKGDKIEINLPVSSTYYHRGGSINNSEDKVSTRQGNSIGLKAKFGSKESFLILDNYALLSLDFSPNLSHAFEHGFGLYSNVGYTHKQWTCLLSYWYGQEFYTPKSGPLFNSASIEGQRITERIRELLFLRTVFTQEFAQDLQVDIRLEPYYDLINNEFEYAVGATLRYNLFFDKDSFKK